MEKIEVLRKTSVGARIAENEKEGLNKYFQKTFLWDQILTGETDIVFGCKGSGKSAIYNFLSNQKTEIFDSFGILAFAENPRGTVAFKDLNTEPPTGLNEFKHIWKLYFIILITSKLHDDFSYNDEHIKKVISKLQDSNLMARRSSLTALVKMVRDFVRNAVIEPNVSLNEHSGMLENIGVKISLNEPSTELADKGVVSVDYLYECLNASLEKSGFNIWVAIDRLDAVFQDNFELEANALKTLFQVYIDLMEHSNIRLLIFFRDDIWNRIIDNGFREASHLTKKELITWDESSLFHLIMSRLISNEYLMEYLGLSGNIETLEDKEKLFRMIFQEKTENSGSITFTWIIDKIEDGNSNVSPRELIHLVNASFKHEVKRILERGSGSTEFLISENSVWKALREVSKTKLETMLAEYPSLKNFINRLKGKKISSSYDELRKYWGTNKKDTKVILDNMIKIGLLFNPNKDNLDKKDVYTIPKLYRAALGY
ncbi:MAG: hypothetical protein JXR19_04260 [Bacteroidia bacterium]